MEICEGNLCLFLRGNEQIACAAVKIVGSPSTEAQDLPSHAWKTSLGKDKSRAGYLLIAASPARTMRSDQETCVEWL